jgi:hypothetical protein
MKALKILLENRTEVQHKREIDDKGLEITWKHNSYQTSVLVFSLPLSPYATKIPRYISLERSLLLVTNHGHIHHIRVTQPPLPPRFNC